MTDSKVTVFLVDDDAGVLKALSRLLQIRGYEIQAFTSPQAHFSQATMRRFPVVLFSTSPCRALMGWSCSKH